MADVVAIGLRALGFVAALQAAGAPLFLWLFGDDLDHSARVVRRFAARAALAGLLLTLMHQLVEPARLVGELRGVFDGSMQAMLLASDSGTAAAVRLLGLALALAVYFERNRLGMAVALAGGTLIAVSFTLMGHTAAADERWLLAGMLIVHLMVVSFWLGALWPLYFVGRDEDIATCGYIVEKFSALAVWLVPLIFVAGLAMSVLLLPDIASLTTPYGLSLLAKGSGFALLMVPAALNKWRLGPRILGGDRYAVRAFRRSLQTEWALIAAVLTVTAVMTASFSPTH